MDEICLPMIRPRELEEGDVSESIHFNTKIKEENIEEEKKDVSFRRNGKNTDHFFYSSIIE